MFKQEYIYIQFLYNCWKYMEYICIRKMCEPRLYLPVKKGRSSFQIMYKRYLGKIKIDLRFD